jgi:hypothetical protein
MVFIMEYELVHKFRAFSSKKMLRYLEQAEPINQKMYYNVHAIIIHEFTSP